MITELSIVIPALNEAGYLPQLLESIARQTYAGKLEVIVVDAKSDDDTVKLAKSFAGRVPGLTVVIAGKRDIGHQRNLGARRAKYRYLLFLDADVVLPPEFLARLTGKVRLPEPFIVAVMHRFEDMSLVDRLFFGIGCLFLAGFLALKKPVTNGDFMLTTRGHFDSIGGFKEGVALGEDVDFGKRSIAAGAVFKFYFRPAIIASLRRAYKMGRLKMLMLYIRGFVRIARHGAIYPGEERYDLPFGHYGPEQIKDSKKKS